MKQTTFFPEEEQKQFTRFEKIKLIFDRLNIHLQPIETSHKNYPLKRGSNNEIWHYSYFVYFNTCNFDNVQNIKIPFPEFDVSVNEQMITISEGKNFKMEFAPEQFLTIYKRIAKIKELQKQ
jgi:hypothetical protein